MRATILAALAASSVLTTASLAADAGPMATTATVEVQGDKGDLKLDRRAQIAFMFLADIAEIEQDCTIEVGRPCTMDEVVKGGVKMSNGMVTHGMTFDPRTTMPDYTFTLTPSGPYWSLAVAPKRKGLAGFYREANFVGTVHYNLNGPASATDPATQGDGISGDSFVKP